MYKLFQVSTIPLVNVTVPVACVPVPALIDIVGAVLYPEPGFVTVSAEIASPVTVAVIANPVPVSPDALVTVTVGVSPEYPVPA